MASRRELGGKLCQVLRVRKWWILHLSSISRSCVSLWIGLKSRGRKRQYDEGNYGMTQNACLAEVTPFCLRSESKPALPNWKWTKSFLMIYYDLLWFIIIIFIILLFALGLVLGLRTPVTTWPNNAENKSWNLNLWPFSIITRTRGFMRE